MSTKLAAVDALTPGSILGDAVLSISGKILLNRGIVVTERIISQLSAWDIKSVYIVDDTAEPEAEQTAVQLITADRGVSDEYTRFLQEYDTVVTLIAQSFDFIRKRKIIPVNFFKDTSNNIANSIATVSSALAHCLMVSDYKLADALTRHSVMVAYLAGSIASHMQWDEEAVKGVIMAGLLHDVGNVVLEKDKSYQRHAHINEAAVLLRETPKITSEVILGVVQHHEFIDGSGIPTGALGMKIHPYARVIAVADNFHSKAYVGEVANPFTVLDVLAHEMFGRLDPSFCHVFISQVKDCLLNTKVLLNDGREAEVIFFHPTGSALPIVKTTAGDIIDLATSSGVSLNRLLSPNEGLN